MAAESPLLPLDHHCRRITITAVLLTLRVQLVPVLLLYTRPNNRIMYSLKTIKKRVLRVLYAREDLL